MKLIELIQNNSNWEEILINKRIKVKYGEGWAKNLAIFNYDILADFTDDIVRESRGVILDLVNMVPVCRPFDKFCNYGEKGADHIDWTSARVQEKVDGSIMKVWFYNGEWRISTNGVIDAWNAYINGSDLTFGDIFTQAFNNTKVDFSVFNTENTYIFELVSSYNRVVIDYGQEPTLWHLGTRHTVTGTEININIGIKKPKEYPLHSLEDCINAAKQLNRGLNTLIEKEGFVVVDKYWRRVKIKSPDYVAVHRLLPNGEINDFKVFEYLVNGEVDEILVYIPSLVPKFNKMKENIKSFIEEVDKYVENCEQEVAEIPQGFNKRKIFAQTHRKDPLFSLVIKKIFDNKEINLSKLNNKQYFALMSKTLKL